MTIREVGLPEAAYTGVICNTCSPDHFSIEFSPPAPMDELVGRAHHHDDWSPEHDIVLVHAEEPLTEASLAAWAAQVALPETGAAAK